MQSGMSCESYSRLDCGATTTVLMGYGLKQFIEFGDSIPTLKKKTVHKLFKKISIMIRSIVTFSVRSAVSTRMLI